MSWKGSVEPEMPHRNWQKRHAIQIVAQLPESQKDALAVLEYAKQLVEGFLAADQPRRAADVRALPVAASSRCNPTGSPSSTPR
jgi:hypothetical protein